MSPCRFRPLPALALILLAGCQHGAAPEEHAALPVEERIVTVTVAPIELRPVQRRIQAVGTLQGLETIEIGAKVSGRVEKVLVDVSDRIKSGEPLLEIDPTDYRLAVNEAQTALERDLAKIGLSKLPDDKFDLETLPAMVRGRLLVDRATRKHNRLKGLVDRAAVAVEEFEQSDTDLRVEQATMQQTILEIRATLASIRYSQALLATAQRKLDETTILAPTCKVPNMATDGVVTFVVAKRSTSAGENVSPASSPLLELVVDDLLKLQATLPERYAGEVKIGLPVEVQIEAYPGEVFSATISRISPTIDSTSRTFEIEAVLPNQEHRLQQGAFAKAAILTRDQEQAVTAPLDAVTTFAGVTKVFQVKVGQAREVPVSIGARGDGWVELIGELDPELPIVTSGQSQLAQGTKIAVRERIASAPKKAAE